MAFMRKNLGFILVAGALVLLAVGMTPILLYAEFGTSLNLKEPTSFNVPPGESFNKLTSRLAREGMLKNPRWLRILAILRGDSGRIQAGEYVLSGRVSPNEFLDFLVSGKARYVSFTIPEGYSLAEIAQRVEEMELGKASEFLRLAGDAVFIQSLNLPISPKESSLEGYLYPETYFIHRGISEGKLLKAMVEHFKKRAAPYLMEASASMNMTPYEVMVLASIIEKETGAGFERPLISAVFHNRLKKKMRLQSDPTVIYGLRDFDGNLKRIHLRTPTAYNTYTEFGLPPTPIANPGLESLKAVLEPAQVKYLYFVSKGDGTHFFSSNYKTHRRAVIKYQKRPHRRSKL